MSDLLTPLKQRLGNRADSEHGQAFVRLAIVFVVLVYFFSNYFAARMDVSGLSAARTIGSISLTVSIAILAAIVISPSPSVVRRLIGMLHDVTVISASIYFGEAAGVAIAVLYLWTILGNGFRFGVRYLYSCAVLSVAGFALVYTLSDYWQGQELLSLNILLTILIVPPYVGSLLKSAYAARDALKHQASVDGLTGLLSRSEMEATVENLLRCEPLGHVLLFGDLDRFKKVNDVAGHAAGDKLLTDFGDIIRQSVRKGDLSGRMGGDEFCVLLRDCTLEKGREIAEEIRSKTNKYQLAWDTEFLSVGVSIGVAPSDAVKDSDSLFRLADAACYAAKNAGRNRVHVIDPQTDLLETKKIRQLFTPVECEHGG